MEAKQALRRVEKVGNADILSSHRPGRDAKSRARRDMSFFGGRAAPLMAQLADAGKFAPDDVRELEKTIRKLKALQKEESK
jgi:hypothetical protein